MRAGCRQKGGGSDSKQVNMAANFVNTNVARVCEGKEAARLCGPALSGSSDSIRPHRPDHKYHKRW